MLAFNDQMALGVVSGLMVRGRSVPGDVSVGGERPASEARAEDEDADGPPEADDRPVWHGDDAQADDGRYSASEAPDFGERT